METSDKIAIIAIIMAGAAVVISAIAMVLQFFSNRKTNDIQAEMASLQKEQVTLQERVVVQDERREIDSKKAGITASITSRRTKVYQLFLKNLSLSIEARNIQCLFDGVPASSTDSPGTPKILKLLPGKETRTTYAFPGGEPPRTIKVTWDDDSGEPRFYEVEV
ncbi:MAG: hypothetical protein IIC13_07550 [SAR324 cluster bacterium]|nr:hypothetical protein [SAR324 cluster bacterium]MCH8886429.1 hypothetical protein [SAR324 cluster bacterium]